MFLLNLQVLRNFRWIFKQVALQTSKLLFLPIDGSGYGLSVSSRCGFADIKVAFSADRWQWLPGPGKESGALFPFEFAIRVRLLWIQVPSTIDFIVPLSSGVCVCVCVCVCGCVWVCVRTLRILLAFICASVNGRGRIETVDSSLIHEPPPPPPLCPSPSSPPSSISTPRWRRLD